MPATNPNDNGPTFTPKERELIAQLQETINKRGVTPMERQIAEAKLDVLYKSKEPEPHNHSHRIRELPETSRSDFNMFHNDEAFERYEMGGHQRSSSVGGQHLTSEDVAQNDIKSIKMNHKIRGTTKRTAREKLEDMAATHHIE